MVLWIDRRRQHVIDGGGSCLHPIGPIPAFASIDQGGAAHESMRDIEVGGRMVAVVDKAYRRIIPVHVVV